MNLAKHYRAVDKARAALNKAERDLKNAVSDYAKAEGFRVTPRPETLRAHLGL